MKSLVTTATLLIAALAWQPALAQDSKKEAAETVAGLPTLPTTSVDDVLAMREGWGTKPSMSSAQPSGKSDTTK